MNRFLRWCFGDTDARRALVVAAVEAGPVSSFELMRKHGGWVYSVLHQMEREGLLTSFDADVALAYRGGRPRRYYRLPKVANV